MPGARYKHFYFHSEIEVQGFISDGPIRAGAYDYGLHKGAGAGSENWYLQSRLRPELDLYRGFYTMGVDYDTATLARHEERLVSERVQSGAWGRVGGGHVKYGASTSTDQAPGMAAHYGFAEVGGDVALGQTGNWGWHGGGYGAAGNMHSTGKAAGSGSDADTAYSVGAYLETSKVNSGAWVALNLQWTRHRFETTPQNGTGLTTHGNGYTVAMEGGVPYHIHSLTLEPQWLYQYHRLSIQGGEDDAARLDFGTGQTHQARAAIKFGQTLRAESTHPVTWWIRPGLTGTHSTGGLLNVSSPGTAGSDVLLGTSRSGFSASADVGVSVKMSRNVTASISLSNEHHLGGVDRNAYQGTLELKGRF